MKKLLSRISRSIRSRSRIETIEESGRLLSGLPFFETTPFLQWNRYFCAKKKKKKKKETPNGAFFQGEKCRDFSVPENSGGDFRSRQGAGRGGGM